MALHCLANFTRAVMIDSKPADSTTADAIFTACTSGTRRGSHTLGAADSGAVYKH